MEPIFHLLVLSFLGFSSAWRVASYWPSKDIVENELNSRMEGEVFRSGDSRYEDLSVMMNTDFTSKPGAIALVKNAEDIRKCILFARKYKLRVTVKSTGHSFVGRSTGDNSLQINVSPMNNITVNRSDTRSDTGASAIVGSGNNWKNVYEEVDKYNLLAIGGSAHTVSIGGYMLGGGHSPMTRMLGLGVDSIIEFTLVTATGDIVTATNTSTKILKVDGSAEENDNADLFWAVRGGGLAYGVVTQYKIKLYHPPPKFEGNAFTRLALFASIDHPFLGNVAKGLLDFYGNFVKNLTNNWGGYISVNGQPACVDPPNCTLEMSNGTLTMTMLHFGGYDQAMKSIKPLLDWAEGRTFYVTANYSSFWEYERTIIDTTGYPLIVYNRLIRDEDFNSSLSELLTTKQNGIPTSCTAAHIGGRAKEIPASTSSVSEDFRNAKWSLSCGAVWETPNEKPEVMRQTKKWKEELYTYGKGVYYNEPDYYLDNWHEEFWGGNYQRLQSIKEIWDPDNFFSCHHCVRVDIPIEPNPCESTGNSFCCSALMILVLFLLKFLS